MIAIVATVVVGVVIAGVGFTAAITSNRDHSKTGTKHS